MLVRRLAGVLLALVIPLVALGAIPTPAHAGPADPGEVWTQVDRNCGSNASGFLCVTVQRSGDTQRVVVALSPKAGHWLKLTSVAYGGGRWGDSFCVDGVSGHACPARTSTARTYSWSQAQRWVVTAAVSSDSGAFKRTAGSTPWTSYDSTCRTTTQGRVCAGVQFRLVRSTFHLRATGSYVPASGKRIRLNYLKLGVVNRSGAAIGTRTVTLCGCLRSTRWSGVGTDFAVPAGQTFSYAAARFGFGVGSTSTSVLHRTPH